eukprot:TRINITY_DN14740_c0_g2_i1.p1 TRINITY_DN14740_c0_g2~~TRINITY_DN14740_c0_g2_i1.p1  ORF type:complete len:859 (-),score=154.09 TRINITY_DN14740_c0_g2_i1:305-2773(-)
MAAVDGRARMRPEYEPLQLAEVDQEAQLGEEVYELLLQRFKRYSTEEHLTYHGFCDLMLDFDALEMRWLEPFFYAMDRNRDGKLDWDEFRLGCYCAEVETVHIINGFTGQERSRFVFDVYDRNRSGKLELDEFECFIGDASRVQFSAEALREETNHRALELELVENGQFRPPTLEQFLGLVRSEKLRGTSKPFRFNKNSKIMKLDLDPCEPIVEARRSGIDAFREELARHALYLELSSDDEEEEAPDHAEKQPRPKGLPAARPPEHQVPTPVSMRMDPYRVADQVLKFFSAPFQNLEPPPADPDASLRESFRLISQAQLRSLCEQAIVVLRQEDMVIQNVRAPAKVFGALHGQLLDVLSHFYWQGSPIEGADVCDLQYTNYTFLGNYSDRGGKSLEVLCLALGLKIKHPDRVVLLRGTHENRHLNFHLGLKAECEQRFQSSREGMQTYELLNSVFELLPLAAVLEGKLLALGGGGLPEELRLEQLRFDKPLKLPEPHLRLPTAREDLLMKLFPDGLKTPSAEAVQSFCARQGLAAVIGSWQIPRTGVAFECDGRLVNVCSCLNYCDMQGGNNAGMLCVTKDSNGCVLVQAKILSAKVPATLSIIDPGQAAASATRRWPKQWWPITPGRRSQRSKQGRLRKQMVVSPDSCVSLDDEETPHLPALGNYRWPVEAKTSQASAALLPTPHQRRRVLVATRQRSPNSLKVDARLCAARTTTSGNTTPELSRHHMKTTDQRPVFSAPPMQQKSREPSPEMRGRSLNEAFSQVCSRGTRSLATARARSRSSDLRPVLKPAPGPVLLAPRRARTPELGPRSRSAAASAFS